MLKIDDIIVAEAEELQQEVKDLLAKLKGKTKKEVQQIFEQDAFNIEKLFLRVSLNPLLGKELQALQKDLYQHSKEGSMDTLPKRKESSEMAKVLREFKPDAIHAIRHFLPNLLRTYEKELKAKKAAEAKKVGTEVKDEAGKKKEEEEEEKWWAPGQYSYLEHLVYNTGYVPESLKKAINQLFVRLDQKKKKLLEI